MFSGIVEHAQKAKSFEKKDNTLRVTFKSPHNWNITLGESICIDGICGTVETLTDAHFSIFFMPETMKITSLHTLIDAHTFNLERSLKLDSLVGGHLVSGHVDTTAKIKSVEHENDNYTITFSLDKRWTNYIIYKGSITVNGVSLTIVSVDDETFSVSLIPYTLSHTNLGELKVGDTVNIEVDLIAKYLEKLAVK